MSSPDGSYTEEQNSEIQVKATVNPTSGTPEFDDEFDDEETLPTIGTCKALYPFEGTCDAHPRLCEGFDDETVQGKPSGLEITGAGAAMNVVVEIVVKLEPSPDRHISSWTSSAHLKALDCCFI